MVKKMFLMIFLMVSGSIAAQNAQQKEMEKMKTAIDSLVNAEKIVLKEKLKTIDNQLDTKEISPAIAEKMRQEASLNFKQKIATERTKIVEKYFKNDIFSENSDEKAQKTEISLEKQKIDSIFTEKKADNDKKPMEILKEAFECNKSFEICHQKERQRVRSGFSFALAFHNLNSEDHFSNDKFRVWGSKSVEIGCYRNVRLLKNNNLLHLTYGLSWMMNKLKMKDSEWFVNNNGTTEIQPFKTETIKSKFKSHYLILPLNLEFDLTPSYTYKNENYYPVHRSFRFGVGAYFGLHLGNKQKVKFSESGTTYKNVSHADFNVNEWIYGLSAHFGFGRTVFYTRYSLVPLFRNNPVKEYPFSVGVRFGG